MLALTMLHHVDHSRPTRVRYRTVEYSLRSFIDSFDSPGRIHHCMRTIGAAQMALDLMIQRVTDPSRKTFGKYLYEHGT